MENSRDNLSKNGDETEEGEEKHCFEEDRGAVELKGFKAVVIFQLWVVVGGEEREGRKKREEEYL